MKKVALIILDGWGHGKEDNSNAILKSKTPFIDSLYQKTPHNELQTDGLAVGLPDGQMGNSEVGHMNIGAGRIVYQDLVKINQVIEKNDLDKNSNLIEALSKAKNNNFGFHVMGLVSDGGIHSHINHLYAICDLAIKKGLKKVFIHAFTDGRDTDPKSGINYISKIIDKYKKTPVKIATIIGRYYAMDRDNRWERTSIAYNGLTRGKGTLSSNLTKEIQSSYNNGVTDEFLKPIIHTKNNQAIGLINPGDIVLCCNFRKDRCRQITSVLTQKNVPEHGMNKIDLNYYTMTCYDQNFKHVSILFDKEILQNTLGEIIAKKWIITIKNS